MQAESKHNSIIKPQVASINDNFQYTYHNMLKYLGWGGEGRGLESGGAKVLGKLPVPGVLLIWISVRQGPIALAVGAVGVVWNFFLSSITSLFFLPLCGRRPDID